MRWLEGKGCKWQEPSFGEIDFEVFFFKNLSSHTNCTEAKNKQSLPGYVVFSVGRKKSQIFLVL